MLKDPVCGMAVTIQSPHTTVHDGISVYFCSSNCKAKFLASPAKYPGPAAANPYPVLESKAVIASANYTCPMHPQISRSGPGSCPICGMALEPEIPTLDDDLNPELSDFRRRFFWTLPLTVIVAVLAMVARRG